MKKPKNTIRSIIKNNQYILKLVSEASPYFILLTVLISLTAFIDTFANTWFSKVVFDGMAEHTPYLQIVKVVLILLGFMLISALVRSYYEQHSSVVENEKIRTHIRTKVLEKTSELDFECFENPEFYEHSLFISNLKTVMDYKPTIEKQTGLLLEDAEEYSIEFKNVSFQYPNQPKPTLKNVSFAFHTGENIALVGHNGAGKSTIVKLIVRLYDVTDGCILINGRDIREYNVFSLRKHFSTVFQDYQSYAVSIADNLLGGVYSPTQKALVDDALEKSGLTQKINALPDGIQTQLSKEFDEKGVSLSGGEMQKLALARVFLRNSPFIILDEPSSALDPIAEHQLTENMLQAAQNKAVLTISHRLSTTRNSTRIYLLNQGSILEEGTHEELICKAGLYKKMFDVQAENYQVNM